MSCSESGSCRSSLPLPGIVEATPPFPPFELDSRFEPFRCCGLCCERPARGGRNECTEPERDRPLGPSHSGRSSPVGSDVHRSGSQTLKTARNPPAGAPAIIALPASGSIEFLVVLTGPAFTGRAEPSRSARRPTRTGRSQCGTTTEFRTLPTSRPDRASRCRYRRRASACSPSGPGRMNRRRRACSSDRDGSRPSGAAPRRPPRGAVAPGSNAATPRAGRTATLGGHPPLMAPVPASCRAASRPGAVLRNAGITSAANRSNCSSITDSGVPMLDCTLTASSPGNCS